MKTSFKRAAAWLLTVLMILSCVPALATGDVTDLMNGVVDLSNAVSTYDVDGDVSLLSIGEQDSITLTVGQSETVSSTVEDRAVGSSTNFWGETTYYHESWSSNDESVATVDGIPDGVSGDDRYMQTNATISGVSEGTAVITHTYYKKTGTLITRYEKHTETITVIVTAKKYTVSFSIGDEAMAAGLSAPDSRTVDGGSVISDLPTMAWDNPDGSPVKVFGGWYSDQAFTTAFTSDTPVNADTTLYAKWLDRYTVSFNVGEEATADGVATPESVTVTEGETVSNLPMPEWKDADGFKKIFAGWYSDEALTTEFTETTPMTADTTTLYAKWVAPDVDGMYYVNFYSQDGQTVHLTIAVAAEKTVRPANGPTLQDKVFTGWSVELQGDKPASDLSAFDFATPVSDAVTTGENTLNLYAWYANQVMVKFISNGGMAVPTQILAEGSTATKVTPTRVGYTFEDWYTDEALTTAFDFNTPVNADITLYAKWTANMVPVRLVYMYENADDAEYSPAGVSEVVYAPAGSYVSIEKSDITSIDQTHNVRYSATEGGDLIGNAKTTQAGNTDATIDDVRDTYFQYNSATNNRQVMPDGSTVMLVYYNRARITLTFTYNLSSNGYINDIDEKISTDDQTNYRVKYTPTKQTSGRTTYDNFTYQFTAKYGQSITAVWPQVGWVSSSGTGDNTFYGWLLPDESATQVTNMYTLESSLFEGSNGNGLSIVDSVLVGAGGLVSNSRSVSKWWIIYARTTLPGETVHFTYNGKDYTIYEDACQDVRISQALGYKDLDGCTEVDGKDNGPKWYGQYTSGLANKYLTRSNKSVYTTYSTMKVAFDTVFPGKIKSGEYCQVLLYDRGNLTLSVWTNADNYTNDPQTSTHLYGDWIYNDDNDLLKTLEQNMAKKGYRFAGWFTNSDFTDGTEYKLDENTRIYGNLNLYAKWEPNQFLAEYYLYMDDTTPYATQGFAEGGKIDNKFVPVAVKDSFLGWYWYDESGHMVPFDFTSTVGKAHVDENGVLKLYAKWEGKTGKVSYLPGIGGDNATQEVTDSRNFDINDASVQLLNYKEVWVSGVPTDSNLTFVGWKAPNGKIYQPGRYVLVTRQLMQFEAQWSSDAVTLIYNANGGTGANVTETWAKNSVVDIWDNMDATTPHFTREGYELIGWDTNANATVPAYQLGQGTITLSADTTTLYAIWKRTTTSATIKKTVSGNFGDQQRDFTFKVKVVDADGSRVDVKDMSYGDDGYYTFTLKHNETRQLENLPIGASLCFHEENYGNYTQTVNQGELTITSKVGDDYVVEITDGMAQIDFVNTYDVTPDTGVVLDSLPYIVILAIVLLGVVLMVRKRRREDD